MKVLVPADGAATAREKVFWFFSSEKNAFLPWKEKRHHINGLARIKACPAYAAKLLCGQRSARLHADRAVQPHGFAVQVAIADHFQRQAGIFIRVSQAAGERNHGAE